jgi:hypothetical protein
MRSFLIHPFTAAIIFSLLIMGGLGAFIVVPIVCINWTWNTIVAPLTVLPHIHMWQACLLYTALACLTYLMGWVQIEFKTETVD